MDKQFESFLNDLAGELKKAAECPVWEIPMNHRTKDSISAFRASVGMLSAIVVDLVKKHRAPADQTEEMTDAAVERPVAETDVFASTEPSTPADPAPIATEAERLFDSDADKPRRRRSHGDSNG
jgi:hypothetical protein